LSSVPSVSPCRKRTPFALEVITFHEKISIQMKMSFTEVPAMFTACVDFYDALMGTKCHREMKRVRFGA
jgi:hypothetical protein